MRISLEINVMTLTFDPVQGRKTFWLAFAIGGATYWVQRWDTERCTPGRRIIARSRDGLMSWTCGKH